MNIENEQVAAARPSWKNKSRSSLSKPERNSARATVRKPGNLVGIGLPEGPVALWDLGDLDDSFPFLADRPDKSVPELEYLLDREWEDTPEGAEWLYDHPDFVEAQRLADQALREWIDARRTPAPESIPEPVAEVAPTTVAPPAERPAKVSASVFATAGPTLLARGYSPIPTLPKTKQPVPNGWNRFCETPPTPAQVKAWSGVSTFGVGLACGYAGLVGVDIDAECPDVQAALFAVLPHTDVRKAGAKGETLFYRAPGLPSASFNITDGEIDSAGNLKTFRAVDIISTGRQTLLPPTIHPDTGRPYVWTGSVALDEIDPTDLPALPENVLDLIAEALRPFGYMAEAPRQDRAATAKADTLDGVQYYRDLNDLAMANLAAWVPALGIYRCSLVKGKGYEGVAHWRPSGRGQPLDRRKLNLKIHHDGIRDFGAGGVGNGQGYTPINLCIAAKGWAREQAVAFLDSRLRPASQEIDVAALIDSADRKRAGDVVDVVTADALPTPPAPSDDIDDVASALYDMQAEGLTLDDIKRIGRFAFHASEGAALDAFHGLCDRAGLGERLAACDDLWASMGGVETRPGDRLQARTALLKRMRQEDPAWQWPSEVAEKARRAAYEAERRAFRPDFDLTFKWGSDGEAQEFATPRPKPRIPVEPTPFALSDPRLIPRRPWVYGELFMRGELTVTVAPGGVGKTSLGIVEALAAATGKALLGGVVPEKPLTVWLVNCEDPLRELQARIGAACIHYGITPADLGERLFVDSWHDADGDDEESLTRFMIAREAKTGIEVLPLQKDLVAAIKARGVDLLIVDPFVSTHSVNEVDPIRMNGVATAWKRVATRANCAISLAHHTRKLGGKEADSEDSRGSTSLMGKARIGRPLNPMNDDQADAFGIPRKARRGYFYADPVGTKSNMTASTGDKVWYQTISVDLGNKAPDAGNLDFGDSVAVVVDWEPPRPERVEIDDAQIATFHTKLKNPLHRWKAAVQVKDQPDWVGALVAEVFGIDRTGVRWQDEAKSLYGRLKARHHVIEHRQGGARGNLLAFAPDDPEVLTMLGEEAC